MNHKPDQKDEYIYNLPVHDSIRWRHIWLNGNQICACYKAEDKENKHNQRAATLINWAAYDIGVQMES